MPRYFPDFEEFTRLAARGRLVPVFRQLVSDTLTPVSAFCCIDEGESAFLFESVIGGEKVGRYSFVGADPFLRMDAFGHELTVTTAEGSVQRTVEDPLESLQGLLAEYRSVHHSGLPRFCGGAVGYAGYDVVRYAENLPSPPEDDRNLPDLSFALYDRMVVFDHINKTVLVVVQARTDTGGLSAE